MPEYAIANYLRLSLDDAKSDSLSIENQRLLIEKHIEDIGIPDVKIMEFVDNGYSGVNFERPAVQRLLEDVRAGKVNCIVVKDFSRFGRNAIETGYFIERVFPLFRVRFISVSDGFDSADYEGDTGGMEVAFKFLMNEYYSRDLSKKIKTAKHEKMRRGESVRKDCLFGYMLNDKRKMVIDEHAADTVRLIFSLALDGNSLAQIAKRLYDDKRPTPSKHKQWQRNNGCTWTLSYIRDMLREEQYTGTYIAGRTKKADVSSTKVIKLPENEWYKIPGHHPAIIDRSLFDAVQALKGRKRETKRKREIGTCQRYVNTNNPLKGKVVCGCCNHAMGLSSTKNTRFQCLFTLVASGAECYKLSISAQDLTEMIYDIIIKQVQIILNIDNLGDISTLDSLMVQQVEIGKQIEMHRDEKCRLYEQFVLGKVDAGNYKAMKASVDVELDRLSRVYASLIAENDKLSAEKAKNDELIQAAEATSGENSLTRPLMDLLISKVFIYPGDRIEIDWKVSGFGTMKGN
jgi:DNA invertase Pin-like site-specific DNA recombinase